MGFDLTCWAEAAPGADSPVAYPTSDKLYYGTGDQIKIKPECPYLVGVIYFAESTPEYVKLDPTSKDPNAKPFYFVRSAILTAITTPEQALTRLNPGIRLAADYITCTSQNATDEDTLVAMLLSRDPIFPKPMVPMTHRITGWADQACTAETWTDVATITWSETLPRGTYQIISSVVGAYKASGPHLGFYRWYGLPRTVRRPGGICVNIGGDKTIMNQTDPDGGNWGNIPELQFDSEEMPSLEILVSEASTDVLIELGLRKIR